jgi:cytochrome d ubiquinol oxidase subunit I
MVTDFSAAIFNPSLFARMSHMTMASFETSAFVVAGISAYYLLKKKYTSLFRRSLGISLLMAAVFAPLQVYLGDVSGRQVFRDQPIKLAAMESHWETNIAGGAPFTVIAFPDMGAEKNLFAIDIPDGLSLLVTHTFQGKVTGLKEFPREDRPDVFILFWSFRLMVAIGFVLLVVMVWAAVLWWQGRLYENRSFLKTLLVIHPLGFLATEFGWITNEVGRQPWLVYHLVRTSEGVSPIPAGNVVWSLSLFLIIFLVVGMSYLYYVFKTLRTGPDLDSPIPPIQRLAGIRVPEETPSGQGH